MDAHLLLAAVLVGAGVGFLSGAFGKGGSAVSTPLLHAAGVPAMAAIASPLPATIPSTLLAGRSYARAGHIDRRVLRVGLLVGIPATAFGALATRWIPGGGLIVATDVVLLVLALRMLMQAHDTDDTPARAASLALVVAVVAVVGAVSGLLGNSGGFLLAPLFIGVLRMPVRRALGTSLALAAALAVPGTIVHAWLGHIDWSLTLAFGLAAVPLASAGARAALRLRERHLTTAYAFGIATLAGGLLVFAH
jgi:uncharacterized membrane protein YfcA